MASKINADVYVSRDGDGAPTFPKGGVISGISTITEAVVSDVTINAAGVNAGIVTSSHFKGNLTGDVNAGIATITSQSIIGSGVTINVGGLDIGPGVITATSYTGDGSNLSGVGDTIRTWEYNPDLYTNSVLLTTGIGITFATKIKAGSGNITLRIAGAAGTVVENFGIGSSVTISNNTLSFTPSSSLSGDDTVYYVNYPPGIITNMNGDSYPGTAYTFSTRAYNYELWAIGGRNNRGNLAQNNDTPGYSSPVQIPGTDWSFVSQQQGQNWDSWGITAIKTDGTLWAWGDNEAGMLGQNSETQYSSPVQIPGTTWASVSQGDKHVISTKTDGTLWVWGYGGYGSLGHNANTDRSSPVQLPGTDWSTSHQSITGNDMGQAAVKTDGTLWAWGHNDYGELGINDRTQRSSPIQIPGTTWDSIVGGQKYYFGTKTDGTLWAWGDNAGDAELGQNNKTNYSSPVQIPGTDWQGGYQKVTALGGGGGAIRTDGTLWTWGGNGTGRLGHNNTTEYSSPKQVGGDTTWRTIQGGQDYMVATKTDGTLWAWGSNSYGGFGLNNRTNYSSPVQIPGTTWHSIIGQTQNKVNFGMKKV